MKDNNHFGLIGSHNYILRNLDGHCIESKYMVVAK
jgi:hypothetical protein